MCGSCGAPASRQVVLRAPHTHTFCWAEVGLEGTSERATPPGRRARRNAPNYHEAGRCDDDALSFGFGAGGRGATHVCACAADLVSSQATSWRWRRRPRSCRPAATSWPCPARRRRRRRAAGACWATASSRASTGRGTAPSTTGRSCSSTPCSPSACRFSFRCRRGWHGGRRARAAHAVVRRAQVQHEAGAEH